MKKNFLMGILVFALIVSQYSLTVFSAPSNPSDRQPILGTNLALNATTSGGTTSNATSYPPAKMFDGQSGSLWNNVITNPATPEVITVSIKDNRPVTFNTIQMNETHQRILTLKVEVDTDLSDLTDTFVEIKTFIIRTAASTNVASSSILNLPGTFTANKLRLTFTYQVGYATQVNELGIYQCDMPNIINSGTVTVTSNGTITGNPFFVADGITDKPFAVENAPTGQTAKLTVNVKFNSLITFDNIRIFEQYNRTQDAKIKIKSPFNSLSCIKTERIRETTGNTSQTVGTYNQVVLDKQYSTDEIEIELSNSSNPAILIYEIQVYNTGTYNSESSNMALNKSATTNFIKTGSTNYNLSGITDGIRGNINSVGWYSDDTETPQPYVIIDMGESIAFDSVAFAEIYKRIEQFQILVSVDGVAYTTAYSGAKTIANPTYTAGSDFYYKVDLGKRFSARYIKFLVTKRYPATLGAVVNEFEVYKNTKYDTNMGMLISKNGFVATSSDRTFNESIFNGTNDDKTINVILASYNGSTLTGVSFNEYQLNKNTSITPQNISVTYVNGYTVKAFVWEKDSLKPLFPVVQ